MPTLKHFAPITLFLVAIHACGQQLVEFDGDTGGSAGRGGTSGTAGTGGRTAGSGGRMGAAGEAGASGSAGEAGASGNAGGGGIGGVGGSAGEGGIGGAGGVGGSAGAGGVSSLPSVVATNPADGATLVAINKVITATFSETMNAVTVDLTLVEPGGALVTGVASYDPVASVASFRPASNLAPGATYTATIARTASDLAGDTLLEDYVWTFMTGTQAAQLVAQPAVQLGAAANFAILGSAAITNIATSKIRGDVGLTPDAGANISGFSAPATCPEITGKMYVVDATGPGCATIDPVLLTNAKIAAALAFINATAAVRGPPESVSGNLNGLTLYPGLYESGSSLQLSPGGFLYLDAQGDPNAVFIIRSATSITTEATSEVVLTKAARAQNVYWTAGSSITLGTSSIMKGTLIAGTSISLLTGANLQGRALNQGTLAEAITLDSSTITLP